MAEPETLSINPYKIEIMVGGGDSFHQLLHNHPHLSSGAGIIGQKRPQYKGLSPTPLAIKKIIMY
jgi:hypothetical protein